MKKTVILGFLGLLLPLLTFAATSYTVKKGDTLYKIAAANSISLTQLIALNPQIKNKDRIYPREVLTLADTSSSSVTAAALTRGGKRKPPPPPPPVSTPTSTPSQAGEVRMTSYTTGYGWPDNTPPGAAISNPVIHTVAGGTGTFSDPVTLAVGHSIISGKDILDYPQGTKFYVPNLRKYFIVEDTCGDGSTPQNGPCHTGYQGHVWLDLWVGGQGLSGSGTLACENTITDLHTAIVNPASNYAVVMGAVYNGSCAAQFGETVVMQ